MFGGAQRRNVHLLKETGAAAFLFTMSYGPEQSQQPKVGRKEG